MSTRLQDVFGKVPPSTLFYMLLCIIVYIIQLFAGGQSACAISAYSIIKQYQIYRIFTSVFTHLSLLHIVFNMLSFYSVGSIVEKRYGSVFFFYLILLFSLLNGLLYVLAYFLLSLIDYRYMYVGAAGLSGVIFTLVVMENHISDCETRSIYGLFDVPRKWYAIILLIIMTLLIPGSSFIGHLCGIITGFLFTNGYINFMLPVNLLIKLEKSGFGGLFKKSSAFTYIPQSNVKESPRHISSALMVIWSTLKTVVLFLFMVIVGVFQFIFDSLFPPNGSEEYIPVGVASGSERDVENGVSQEEIRKQRLAALEARR